MPFAGLKLHPSLLAGLKDLGFTRPTGIQGDAIPPAMEGRDLLACATTGSGKTAAFLLPILHRLIDERRGITRTLVLTPTRELAAQILADLNDLAVHTPITAASVFGGVGMGPQEHALRSGVDVLIATPGRLLDHLRRPYGKLSGLKFLVLDEADRMLDMGFLPDIRRILQQLPTKRQTLFFSATMPPPIAALAGQMLRDPVTINLERRAAPAVGITQAVYPVQQHLKATLLLELLKRGEIKDALVFTRTKHRADKLMRFLLQNGLAVERIHGNRSQNQRTEALEGFKSGRYQVLVATDIAARGIDVTALGHVVNFDVPHVPDDYIHRVGRTARAELTGTAFTLLAPDEETLVRAIERAIDKRLPRVTLSEFDYNQRAPEPVAARHTSGPSGHHGSSSRQRGRPEPRPAQAPGQARHPGAGRPSFGRSAAMGAPRRSAPRRDPRRSGH